MPLLQLLLAFHYYTALLNMAAGTWETLMQHGTDTNCLQNAPKGEAVSDFFFPGKAADPNVGIMDHCQKRTLHLQRGCSASPDSQVLLVSVFYCNISELDAAQPGCEAGTTVS